MSTGNIITINTTVRIEDCIWDISNNKPMQHTYWVFSGSKIINGTYMADVERSNYHYIPGFIYNYQ